MSAARAIAVQKCIDAACGAEFPVDRILTACPACATASRGESLLDVVYDWAANTNKPEFERLFRPNESDGGSGVWRFRDLLPFLPGGGSPVSVGEGKTILQQADDLARTLGFRESSLFLQYEGLNPSGSFKDNGMAAGFTHARMVGAKVVACASTGNTSASLALYAREAGMKAIVFIGDGKIALGKLSQALDYGATTLQIAGDFDACLARVRDIASDPKRGVYLLNSLNPFRLEGQKTIMFRVRGDLGRVPDWIVVPGGNLGNCSAFAKAFVELRALGLIDRLPRLAVINAHGARTFDRMVNELGIHWQPAPTDPMRGAYDRAAVAAEYAPFQHIGILSLEFHVDKLSRPLL